MTEIIMIIESRSSSSANKQYYLFTYVHKYQSLVQHKRMMHLPYTVLIPNALMDSVFLCCSSTRSITHSSCCHVLIVGLLFK